MSTEFYALLNKSPICLTYLIDHITCAIVAQATHLLFICLLPSLFVLSCLAIGSCSRLSACFITPLFHVIYGLLVCLASSLYLLNSTVLSLLCHPTYLIDHIMHSCLLAYSFTCLTCSSLISPQG